MTGPLRRPSEFELHGFIDGRIEPMRAAEIDTLLSASGERERVDGWLRGRDALRLVYDPLAHETPPAFLLDVARGPAREAPPGPAAAPAGRRRTQDSLVVLWLAVAVGFFAGSASTLLGSALIARFVDPAATDFPSALSRAVGLVLRGLGFGTP